MTRCPAVYILASKPNGTLYIGVTNDISRRLEQHRLGLGSQFVRDYKVYRLVHVEAFDDPESAIQRENASRNGIEIGKSD